MVMTTSLAVQLAQIRAKGSNPLDLKAQKKEHSQSLLFASAIAATQDFDSIFSVCNEGFHELCRLDSRFTGFAKNIFSEQSKRQDRTQMTTFQNDQLNAAIEDFLGLVGGRLLLKPALKAVEWLVRRFRIQENNTVCMVITFLPYHTTPVFPTLLSILPQRLPQELRFLHPYVQSLENPPRHAIVYTAAHNNLLFARLTTYVLEASKLGYHYPALISFWATTVTEAVAVMLDLSRSGRPEAQRQSQEDIVLRIMPILNDGLHLENIPDLQVGCYMILTVLVTKCALENEVLSALMAAIASGLTPKNAAGLICLAVIAEQREVGVLPKKVLKALLKIERLENDLLILKPHYNVGKLVLGIILGILGELAHHTDAHLMSLVRLLFEANLMDKSKIAIAIRCIMLAAHTDHQAQERRPGVQSSLIDLLLCLSEKDRFRSIMKASIGIPEMELDQRFRKAINLEEHGPEKKHDAVELEHVGRLSTTVSFEDAVSRIPGQMANEMSFLPHSGSDVFDSLVGVFLLALPSSDHLKAFSELPVLRKSLSMTEPLYLSFFVRVWCSNYTAAARTAAINIATATLNSQRPLLDVQFLLPYILYGLADSSLNVRKASVNLVIALRSGHSKDDKEKRQEDDAKKPILGESQIYGQGKKSSEVIWLSTKEVAMFIKNVLVPSLEECLLDSNHILQYLSNFLKGAERPLGPQTGNKKTKTSLRQAFFAFLCSHVVNTPMYNVKCRLLKILSLVEKVGKLSRTKALLPLLSENRWKSKVELEELCGRYQISPPQLLDQLVGIVSPKDSDGVHILQSIIERGKQPDLPMLLLSAHQRIREIWCFLSSDWQLALAKMLLELAIEDSEGNSDETWRVESILTLRSVPLSTAILQFFLESLSAVPNSVPNELSAPKRRRTNHGRAAVHQLQDPQSFRRSIKRIGFILELIEACHTEEHPQLLKGLFQVMSDLQQLKDQSGMDLGYLEVLAMGNIRPIVKKLEGSPGKIDKCAIKPNVVIDCLRTTTSLQAQQTALLLVSSLATVTSELVLHSIMPIFTFMGTTTLRQNDEYSAYVVSQTMESVIPRLVESLHNRNENPIIGTLELLFSFVAAFEHISPPRRLDLFKSLANKLGPTDFLFALLVLLLDKYPDDRSVTQFGADLTGNYDALTQLQTVEKYITVNLDILKSDPTIAHQLISIRGERSAEKAIIRMLPLLTAILRGEQLIREITKILKGPEQDATLIRDLYAQLLEKIVVLSENTRHDNRLELVCRQVLDSLIFLLPSSGLLAALQGLLISAEDEVRLQVLISFQQRLILDTSDRHGVQKAGLASLPQLTVILEESSSIPLKHAVLACIDFISEKFGKKDVAAVLAAATVIARSQASVTADVSLDMAILLCLATMVEVIRDGFVPLVPTILPKALGNLSAGIADEDARLHNAAYSLICALLLHIPWIIAGTYLDRLLEISYESANAELGDECNDSRLEALKLVAKQLKPDQLFTALDKSWKSAMTEGPKGVNDYLFIFRSIIEQLPKSMVGKQSGNLTNIVIKAFDLRRIQFSPRTEDSFEDPAVEDVEAAVFSAAIAMIYKLNDATFRPMFSRIWEWTIMSPLSKKDKNAKMHRRTTLYAFLGEFFNTLKSIVTSYADFIIEDTVDILRDVSLQDKDSVLLWRRVIAALRKAFEYDQEECLLSQLSHASQVSMTSEVIPAITELAVAADSADHHKGLNGAILHYMRSDNPAVRLAAVQCEYSLTERLGEEWLCLLPEMLPFISELQEDDDETVEEETQKWIKRTEEILGESLNPMLQ